MAAMAIVAAMVAAMAMPAFAKTNCNPSEDGRSLTCRGGAGGGGDGYGGGFGGIFVADNGTVVENTGGGGFGGSGEGGGVGGKCTTISCTGNR